MAPVAPAAEPERFTGPFTMKKSFKRNCNDVPGRECAVRRKGNLISHLTQLKPQEPTMNLESKRRIFDATAWTLGLFAAAFLVTEALASERPSASAADAAWPAECASRPTAYPPRPLTAQPWRTTTNGLGLHFGVDASVDADRGDFSARNLRLAQ